MKRISKYFALLLAVLLCASMLPVSAAGANDMVLGEKGTFYAPVWTNTDGAHNLYKPFVLVASNSTAVSSVNYSSGTIAVARKMKAYFDTVPAGKRVLNPAHSLAIITDGRVNLYWYDEGVKNYIAYMDEVIYYYKRLGGPDIDFYMMDFERYCNVWYAEGIAGKLAGGMDELYTMVENDPRYPELRQEIIDAGIRLYEGDDHPELYYLYAHANDTPPNDPLKRDVYLGINQADDWVYVRYIQPIFESLKEHYPNITFSDYGTNQADDPRLGYTSFGHNYGIFSEPTPVEERVQIIPGTHSSPTLYLQHRPGLETAVPVGYPYEKFYSTPFNTLLYTMVNVQNDRLYMPGTYGFRPWVGSYSWSYANYGTMAASDYYKEFIYHLGLSGLDCFLFYNYESGQQGINDNLVFSELLDDLDEVVGFPDRVSLIDSVTPWTNRYILSGMTAGGKNVWRITPDLTTEDITIESFKVKDEPLTFQIGQQVIEFPEGSFIYEPTRKREHGWYSEAGYWVITPEGTEPKEYTDSSAKPVAEPVYTWGGKEEQAERVAAYFARMGAGEVEKQPSTGQSALTVDLAAAFKKLFSKNYRALFDAKVTTE